MTTARTVAVTGATGFVGRHIVAALADAGHTPVALVRDPRKAQAVLPSGTRTVIGDVNDADALDTLVQDADALMHLVGIIRQRAGGVTFQNLHVRATRSVTDALRRNGVARLLHMSAFGVCDEPATDYFRTKLQAEEIVRASGLEWTIFRPGLIHGPGGEFTGLMMHWARGRGPLRAMPYFLRPERDVSVPFPPTRYVIPRVAPVYVGDVAHCFVRALDEPRTVGEIIHLTGPETLTFPDLYAFVRAHTPAADRHARIIGVPADRAAAGARVAQALGLGPLLPFDPGMAVMGAKDIVDCNTKALALLSPPHRPFTDVFPQYAS